MENPFFEFSPFTNSYYEAPRPRYFYYPAPRTGAVISPGSNRSVPDRKQAVMTPSPSPSPSQPQPQPQPKVVSIPVHFVGTEKSRATAAVKIQKVLRGFLVRRAVKKVLKIAAEVADVERRLAQKETVEMVRREEKERLRLNEVLMGLLFRLDSVQGFDSGVRGCRKKVIRRVIALQERVDAIAAGDVVEEEVDRTGPENPSRGGDGVDAIVAGDTVEGEEIKKTDSENCSVGGEKASADLLSNQPSGDENQSGSVEGEDAVKETQSAEVSDITSESAPLDEIVVTEEPAAGDVTSEDPTPAIEKSLEDPIEIVSGPVLCEQSCNCDEYSEPMAMGESLVLSTEAYGSSIDGDKEVVPEKGNDDRQNCGDDKKMEDLQVTGTNENMSRDDFKGVMERMVDENMKLQRMLADLCERNVAQSRLLNSLSLKVEQLEKVMSRKKKKRHATGTAEDLRKCGKKM